MKKLLVLCVASLITSGCATGPSSYGPATEQSSLGFKAMQIEEDRFRVSYTGRSSDEAQDYALLRAAEITLDEGYTHFKVITGHLENSGQARSPVSSSIGIGFASGGRGYYGRRGGSHTSVGLGININDVARALQGDRVTNSIEILLRHEGGDEPNIYNAESVADSIRPEVFQ